MLTEHRTVIAIHNYNEKHGKRQTPRPSALDNGVPTFSGLRCALMVPSRSLLKSFHFVGVKETA
jgi:hypothetical protein